MVVSYVLGLSIILQFIAAALAFRLIWVTGRQLAWLLISSAILLMAVRRSISFSLLVPQGVQNVGELSSELVALVISLLMVVGIGLIGGVLREKKAGDQALRATQERYRQFVENAHEGILSVDEQATITFVNGRMAEMVGCSPEEVVGKPITSFFFEEDLPGFENRMQRRRLGEKEVFEHRLRHKDGTEIWALVSAAPLFDDEGRFRGSLAMATDITQLKLTQERLQWSEEKFSKAFLKAPMIMTLTNVADGVCLEVNDKYCELSGFTREEVVGRSSVELGWLSQEAREQLIEKLKVDGRIRNVELEQSSKDKREFIFNYSGEIIFIGGRPVLLSIAQDITELRKAQKELQLNEQKYRDLFEEAPSMYVITRSEQGIPFITNCNQLFLSVVGHLREDVIGKPLADLYSLDSQKKLLEGGGYSRALAGDYFMGERELATRDGKLIQTLLYTRPELDDSRNVIGTRAMFVDVTQQKQAEMRLAESEERFYHAFENANIGVSLVDISGRLLQVNSQMCEMFGYSRSEMEAMTVNDIAHPEDLEISPGFMSKALSGEIGRDEFEKRYIDKHGQIVWGRVSSSLVRDAQGNPLYFISHIRDITERKRVEQLTNKRMDLLEFAGSHSFEEVLQYALDEIEAFTNSTVGFYHFVSNDQETISQQAWSTRTLNEFCTAKGKGLHCRIEEAGVWGDCVHERRPVIHNDYNSLPHRKGLPDGHPAVIRLLVAPIVRTGRIVAILGVGNKPTNYTERDVEIVSYLADVTWEITYRKRVEAEREHLASAIEQASEVVMVTDVEGTIQYVNPAFEKITGYPTSEALGQNPRLLKSGEHDRAFYADMWNTIKAGNVWTGRFTNRRKDGRLYHEEATISPVRNPSGNIVSFVGVKRDITEHLELSRQLIQAQKMEAIGTLAGGIAHDFNNLLQVVLGYSEFLLSRKHETDAGYKELRKIHEAGKRGASLVQNLLMFSRKAEPKFRRCNVNQEIVQVQELLFRTIPKMIKIDLRLSGDLEPIQGDPFQIGQVLMNLGVNARDAMPDSGTLTIETTNVELDAVYCATHLDVKAGRYVLLTVSDSGHGMDKETVSHIFEPFFSTKDVGKGTGLGLATVYGIIKQHSGHIICYSEPGVGTTFKIYLPALERETETEDTTSETAIRGGTETILLADDEEAVRDLGAAILAQWGYQLLTAADGKEALAKYLEERESISLVILDLIMPEMDGKHCLAEILRIDSKARVLIASGYSKNGPVPQAELVGAMGFIEKPFDMRNLLRTVREVLDGE